MCVNRLLYTWEPGNVNSFSRVCLQPVRRSRGFSFLRTIHYCIHPDSWLFSSPSDGLHLTPEGNALVHKEVVQTLRGAGLKAEDMAHDFPHHSKIDGICPEKAFQWCDFRLWEVQVWTACSRCLEVLLSSCFTFSSVVNFWTVKSCVYFLPVKIVIITKIALVITGWHNLGGFYNLQFKEHNDY
jgi:hypothetical protein